MSVADAPAVHGHAEDGWGGVVDAFAATIDQRAGGAALSIQQNDRCVVDVFAGMADIRTGRQWAESTPTVLFSATKGLAALTVAWLSDHGRIDLDVPVASYWPEFAAGGKEHITAADVLAHRAGLPAPDAPLSRTELLDNRLFAARLSAQVPLWPEAQSHLYHPVTWGPLTSEIVRRASGEEIGAVFDREIAGPCRADIAIQPGSQLTSRVAHATNTLELEALNTTTIPLLGELAIAGLTAGGALPPGLVGDGEGLNEPEVLSSGLVSAGGVGTAAGLARVWGSLVGRSPFLSPAAVETLIRVRSQGPGFQDTSNGRMSHRWGVGVQLASPALPLLTPRSFGHDGAGGQCGFADPDHALGFGYLRNQLCHVPVVQPIIDAVREVIA